MLHEYESGNNNNNMIGINNYMTPYKGSMLGGTILGEMEESSVAILHD